MTKCPSPSARRHERDVFHGKSGKRRQSAQKSRNGKESHPSRYRRMQCQVCRHEPDHKSTDEITEQCPRRHHVPHAIKPIGERPPKHRPEGGAQAYRQKNGEKNCRHAWPTWFHLSFAFSSVSRASTHRAVPSVRYSFFQKGASVFNQSIMNSAASKAAARWGLATMTSTI